MPRTTPRVENDALQLGPAGAEQTIAVGSPDWFAWVEAATAFTFVSPQNLHRAARARQQRPRRLVLASVSAPRRRAAARLYRQSGRADRGTAARGGGRLGWRGASASLGERTVGAVIGADPPLAAPALPSGTATFLFTDIEGSTQLWERHSLAMPNDAIERLSSRSKRASAPWRPSRHSAAIAL